MVIFSFEKDLTSKGKIGRIFLGPDFFDGELAYGPKEEAHYVKNVLRGTRGDEIVVLNGLGEEFKGIIEELDNKGFVVRLKEKVEVDRETSSNIIVAQGLCKKDKWEMILQKTTELGIDKIQPFYSENSVVRHKSNKDLNKKLLRWEKILKNASQQSDRQLIPELNPPLNFEEMIKEYSENHTKIIFNEHEEKNDVSILPKVFSEALPTNPVMLVVGPEGGFTKKEINIALENGFKSVALGRRILRTETAAVVVTAIVLYQLGEMGVMP